MNRKRPMLNMTTLILVELLIEKSLLPVKNAASKAMPTIDKLLGDLMSVNKT